MDKTDKTRALLAIPFEEPLLSILRRYAWSVPVMAALGFVSTGLEGLGIGLLIPLLGSLLTDGGLTSHAAFLAPVNELLTQLDPRLRQWAISGAMLFLIIIKCGLQAINSTLVARMFGSIGDEIRCKLSHQLLTVGFPFYLEVQPSRLFTILSTDAWKATDAIRWISSIVVAWAAVIVFSVMLILVEWRLFFFVALGVAIIRGIQILFVHRLNALSERATEANWDLEQQMLLTVDAKRLVRIFGSEKREQRRFESASDKFRGTMYSVEIASARMYPAIEFLHAALFLAALLTASTLGMDVPTIVTFLVLFYRMQPHFLALNQARLGLAAARGSIRAVESLLDPRGKPPSPSGDVLFSKLCGPIVFENVSFTYSNRPKSGDVLRNLNFAIGQGRITALIGRSGAGKSTIVSLLCRLLEPTSGRIAVNGVDLSQIEPESWLRHIGVAGQDLELVDGTIAENIAYGVANASEKEISEAARRADAEQFIIDLPQGYHTRVGARGLGLSGGQRQRIGLARALIRKPMILILDEATNEIDGLSETAIISLLKGRSRHSITLVISHRRTTLACCDVGVFLDEGTVTETGLADDLEFFRGMGVGGHGDCGQMTDAIQGGN